jgi:hypothetical protein
LKLSRSGLPELIDRSRPPREILSSTELTPKVAGIVMGSGGYEKVENLSQCGYKRGRSLYKITAIIKKSK